MTEIDEAPRQWTPAQVYAEIADEKAAEQAAVKARAEAAEAEMWDARRNVEENTGRLLSASAAWLQEKSDDELTDTIVRLELEIKFIRSQPRRDRESAHARV